MNRNILFGIILLTILVKGFMERIFEGFGGSINCTGCNAETIAKNLGDQYRNDPNICNSRANSAQCAAAGGLWKNKIPKKEDGSDWKIAIDEKTGNLVFNYKGNTKSTLTRTGEWSSDKRKCGAWNIRKSSIGIPGRGDIYLHTDGSVRALNYDTEQPANYNKG